MAGAKEKLVNLIDALEMVGIRDTADDHLDGIDQCQRASRKCATHGLEMERGDARCDVGEAWKTIRDILDQQQE